MKGKLHMKVKLQKVIDSLYMVNREIEYYYNPIKEEFFSSNIGEFEDLAMDELDELFENSIILPINYEINKYQMMINFIQSIKDTIIYDKLKRSITGKGAFRRFKDTCIIYGIIDDWYKFENEEYKKIAMDWCNKNNIEFE